MSYALQTESTYDWKNEQWSAPIGAIVSKVTDIGAQTVSIAGGIRYWIDSPEGSPEGRGARLVFTLLFPR